MGKTLEEAHEEALQIFENNQIGLDDAVEPGTEAVSDVPVDTQTDAQSDSQIQPAEETVPATEQAVQQGNEGSHTEEIPSAESALADAANTAEAAAQFASQQNQEISALRQQLETITKQNQQLQDTINQMSQQQEETIVEDILKPPVLDRQALAFADDETARRIEEQYIQDMVEYSRKTTMKELQPLLDQAKKGQFESEKAGLVDSLASVEQFADIKELMPQIEHIIEVNPVLSNPDIPLDDKITIAYAMAKGVNVINNPPVVTQPKEPTVEELLAYYENNDEFQNAIEQKRLAAVKQNQQVPAMSASSGAANAVLNIPEEPKTLDEASVLARKIFGAK